MSKFRSKVNRRRDKRRFSRTADHVNVINKLKDRRVKRGGYRL